MPIWYVYTLRLENIESYSPLILSRTERAFPDRPAEVNAAAANNRPLIRTT